MAAADFEFDGVVRLTRIGGGYLVFTLIVGFAALNTGNNSLYITLAFMLGALILSGIASKGGLKHIRVELCELSEAWATKPARGLLRVRSESRFWSVRDIVITSRDLAHPVVLPVLAPRREALVPVDFLFFRRGRVALKTIDLYTRYPFGLFVKKRRARISGEAVVYPKLLERETDPRHLLAAMGEAATVDRSGHGPEIFAFREYARGDSLRHVHWRRSASLDRWVIKEHSHEAGRLVEIVFDPVVPPGTDPEEFEHLVSEAATVTREAIEAGFDVVLVLPDRELSSRDTRSRLEIFEALALIQPREMGLVPDHAPGSIVLSLRSHAA